ncbi:MAG: ABC transporter substrate-binding protein [Desulfovibrionaceae bacterium]
MVVLFVVCLAVGGGARGAAHAQTLRLGILPVLDTLPLQVASLDGLFRAEGLDVELVSFASALERDTAMQSGRLDGYFGDLVATLLLIKSGVPMRIVTTSWRTNPGRRMFSLMLAPGRSPVGKLRTGISQATVIEYLLDRMQARHPVRELDMDRMEIKKIPIRLQLLLSGQLDAAMLPEPLATLAKSKGASIVASDEILDVPLTVLCLHEVFSAMAPAFLRAYGAAVERINVEPNAYRNLMVAVCSIPGPLAADFPVYQFPVPVLPNEAEIMDVEQWMMQRGMLVEPVAYDTLVIR